MAARKVEESMRILPIYPHPVVRKRVQNIKRSPQPRTTQSTIDAGGRARTPPQPITRRRLEDDFQRRQANSGNGNLPSRNKLESSFRTTTSSADVKGEGSPPPLSPTPSRSFSRVPRAAAILTRDRFLLQLNPLAQHPEPLSHVSHPPENHRSQYTRSAPFSFSKIALKS